MCPKVKLPAWTWLDATDWERRQWIRLHYRRVGLDMTQLAELFQMPQPEIEQIVLSNS